MKEGYRVEFIIWGAGVRGRRVRQFLKNEKILAYIDARTDLYQKTFDGIDVVDFDYYLKNIKLYRNAWIIVTPLFFADVIVKMLKDNGIKQYFDLRDCPDSFYDYDIERFRNVKVTDGVLYGFTLCNWLIACKKREIGEEMAIVVSQKCYCNIESIDDDIKLIVSNDIDEEKSRRLVEDFLKTEKLDSDYRLKKFKNIRKGERCFIVATGPSLAMKDLDTLYGHNELCISMNGIYLSAEMTKWRPDFFVMTDQSLIDYESCIDKYDAKYKIISDNNMDYWKKKHANNVYKIHMKYNERDLGFSDDILNGVFSSGSVTYVCIQLAVYLGCNQIYLLGTDFHSLANRKNRNSHFIEDYNRDEKTVDGRLIFENIYSDDIVYNNQLRGYMKTKSYCETHNIKVFNATRGGALEVFPRVNFDSLFEDV